MSTPVDPGAAAGKAHQIHARAAAKVEHRLAGQPVKGHQPQQVMELVEVIFVEVVEEPGRSGRVTRNRQIVDVLRSSSCEPGG